MLGTALKARHLGRYKDIVRLLLKYGHSDLVSKASLEEGEPELDTDGKGDPKAFALDLERLGPTFIKLGQLLSSRSDLIPERYLDALSKLQDSVAPFPFEQAVQAIESELGVPLKSVFRRFEPVPKAAASLGQIHRARLRDGSDVAVKVQRPGVRSRFIEDLEAISEAALFLDSHTRVGKRYEFGRIAEELRRTLFRELDYVEEARNLIELGENLADFKRIVVPQPHVDYCTSRVLTMDFVTGRKITELTPLALTEIDARPLADELFKAYLKQILIDGFFHADPHPGNVMLTRDGKLALLDLGMISRLPPTLQDELLALVVAVVDSRSEKVGDIALKVGYARRDFDEEAFRSRLSRLVLHHKGATVSQLDTGRIILEISRSAAGCGLRLPTEMTFLSKALLNLDQAVWALDPEYSPAEVIRSQAAQLMSSRVTQSIAGSSFISGLLDLKRILEQWPARFERFLDIVSRNELRLNVDTFDEEKLLTGMQKIANRIASGLILGALIVGAALLMRVETKFKIFEYPGLAILFFLAAAGGGIALLIDVFYSDSKEGREERLR